MRNANREKFIPYEKASIIVKDINKIFNQIGGNPDEKGDTSGIVDNLVNQLVENKAIIRKRIDNYNEFKSTDDEDRREELKMTMGGIEKLPFKSFGSVEIATFICLLDTAGTLSFTFCPVKNG